MIRLEVADIEEASVALEGKGLSAIYDLLAANGDKYAELAQGA